MWTSGGSGVRLSSGSVDVEQRWLAEPARFGAAGPCRPPRCGHADRVSAPHRGARSSRLPRAKPAGVKFAEYTAHRSVYGLKEADPHSFGIPRLFRAGQGRPGRNPG